MWGGKRSSDMSRCRGERLLAAAVAALAIVVLLPFPFAKAIALAFAGVTALVLVRKLVGASGEHLAARILEGTDGLGCGAHPTGVVRVRAVIGGVVSGVADVAEERLVNLAFPVERGGDDEVPNQAAECREVVVVCRGGAYVHVPGDEKTAGGEEGDQDDVNGLREACKCFIGGDVGGERVAVPADKAGDGRIVGDGSGYDGLRELFTFLRDGEAMEGREEGCDGGT
ncbi:hypothetical protein DFH09DRAFT_1085801 [Mycena vulgaris]|nr:hypothetical protein DFH09DRAFT_1085801 [Mycena vulgaris]